MSAVLNCAVAACLIEDSNLVLTPVESFTRRVGHRGLDTTNDLCRVPRCHVECRHILQYGNRRISEQ